MSREDWRVIPVAVVVTALSDGTVTVPVNVGLLDVAFVNELFTTADELLVIAVLNPSSLD